MNNTKTAKTRIMVESAMLIALATVLSVLKVLELPYGGSITLASMLPIILISYRHGLGWGLSAGIVFGIIQQLLGLSNLSYVTTWQSILAIILLDYVIAFAVTGIGGIFRGACKNQTTALLMGSTMVCILRYICHVVVGATVWMGISIPDKAAIIYSLAYNATYMIPETVVLLTVTAYVGSMIDFRSESPQRMIHTAGKTGSGIYAALCGFCAVCVTIFDVVSIFSKLQNGETGNFEIAEIVNANWTAIGCVTAVGVILCILFAMLHKSTKKHAENQS